MVTPYDESTNLVGGMPQNWERQARLHRQQTEDGGDRVAIFIDGSNLFYASHQLGIEIDYTRLLAQLLQGQRLLRAYFYTGVDPNNEKQQGFLLWMRRHGYRVITKPLVHLPDGTRKANLDVEMAVDMITIGPYCSKVILLSGDGDLAYAANHLSYRGVQIEVVSLLGMTSDLLIDVADRYTDLQAIKHLIAKANLKAGDLKLEPLTEALLGPENSLNGNGLNGGGGMNGNHLNGSAGHSSHGAGRNGSGGGNKSNGEVPKTA
jgi:uncharacterized LabA/DUF88 family protein